MKRIVTLGIFLALFAPLSTLAATFNLDPYHSAIQFKVKHLMITNVKGVFEKFKGTVVLDEKDITASKVDVSIEMASVNTNIAKRDEHLRGPDFFDVTRFPAMTFVSTRVEKAGNGLLKVTGNLTIKGVTKPVVLTVEGPTGEIKSPQGDLRRGASATATVNRQDFGVSWNKKLDGGGVVLADEVFITIDTEMSRQ
jgi:polyisoprenoid-binding protein YceI